MAKKCPFFPPCGAKSWGSGGAPPTNLILLRNQLQAVRSLARAAPARAPAPRRSHPGPPGALRRPPPSPRPVVGGCWWWWWGWGLVGRGLQSSGGSATLVIMPSNGGKVSTPIALRSICVLPSVVCPGQAGTRWTQLSLPPPCALAPSPHRYRSLIGLFSPSVG